MYLTNNIVEAVHSKINTFLTKYKYNKYKFVKCLENIVLQDSIKSNDFIRHYYITKGLLVIIEKEKLNKNVRWIDYEILKEYFKNIKITLNNNINISIKELTLNYDIENNKSEIIEDDHNIVLANLGCTCYLNSILQFLFHINIFRNFIINLKIQKEKHNVLYALKYLFNEMINNCNVITYITPDNFIKNYDDQIINVYQQKEAFEFLIDLLDKLEKRLLSINYIKILLIK